ncbi:VanW family protein [Entomospira nematocerorum]|uniref:VanW family protein n=1 Tax=Entomospira nematocerorum TaxID=2719987 RepID=A0A968KY26_9SPIO|nr:VanW family protein [Entomospira nematocera]NIZ47132.1 VanW family protein [Entomospira nematocera]WDI34324.1 VanW family protein [Entomospira nematocera]
MKRKRLTQLLPCLLPLRKAQRLFFYQLAMRWDRHLYASTRDMHQLPARIFRHKSLLRRKLGESDPMLQINKVANLTIASNNLSGVIIKPQEVFSFWHLVGTVSYRNGYCDGMLLSDGEVSAGVGGGLCQLGNLLFWMFLHTPLEIVERYRHSFDPFPDSGRVIPFGTGATLVQGWKDLKVKNTSNQRMQLLVWLDDRYIHGEIRADDYPIHSYHIMEREHRFVKKTDGIYRQNRIYRQVIDRRTGNMITEEHLFDNDSLIKYSIDTSLLDNQLNH